MRKHILGAAKVKHELEEGFVPIDKPKREGKTRKFKLQLWVKKGRETPRHPLL